MKYLSLNKRAVSPLIAIVLLLVVVVGVGSIIAGIARNYVTESKQQTDESAAVASCSTQLDFDFVVLNEDLQVCKNSTHITFMVENKAGEIDDFQVKVFSANNVVTNDSVLSATESLPRGGTGLYAAAYSGINPADIVEVQIIPKITSPSGTSLFCTDVKLVAKNLDTC